MIKKVQLLEGRDPDADHSYVDSIAYELRDTYRAVARAFQAEAEQFGVSMGMWMFLRALRVQDGLTQKELTNSAGLMQPGTSAALKQMERLGLIRQEEDKDDRRKVRIYLTPKSRRLLRQLVPISSKVRTQATSDFTKKEVILLINLLGRIKANIAGAPKPRLKRQTARRA